LSEPRLFGSLRNTEFQKVYRNEGI